MSRPGLSYEPLLSSWNVGAIVADICARAGVPAGSIYIDELEGAVEGFSVTNANAASSAIEALAAIYLFDPSNFDGKLHFIPRGGAVVAAITSDDLVEGSETESSSRRDSLSVPRALHLQYLDTLGGLTTDKQTSDRSLDNRSNSETKMETTVIMRADDAARAAVISHKVAIEEQRGEVEFSLPDSWCWLTVADIITLDGVRLRITEIQTDEGQQAYKCQHDRASAYDSVIAGVPIVVPTDPPGLIVAESVMEFIDSHILRSSDDALGYYIAVSSPTQNWTGASVELSTDGGANWIDSDGTEANAIMGALSAGIPAHAEEYPDMSSVLKVTLLRADMELISATQGEMQNRVNLAIIGNELINFSGVNQITATEWELTGLLRGRKGSAAVVHIAGERFVLLDRNQLSFIEAELFELGRPLTFRAISYGLTTGTNKTVTFAGVSQKERAPAYLAAPKVSTNLVVSWQGVGRLGGGASVGMGKYFTSYRVTLNGSAWDTTAQTLTIPYAAGTLSVQQNNSITGLGPAATVTV